MIIMIWVLVWAVVCVMDEKLTPARLPTTRGQGHHHHDDDEVDDDDDGRCGFAALQQNLSSSFATLFPWMTPPLNRMMATCSN